MNLAEAIIVDALENENSWRLLSLGFGLQKKGTNITTNRIARTRSKRPPAKMPLPQELEVEGLDHKSPRPTSHSNTTNETKKAECELVSLTLLFSFCSASFLGL